MVLALLHLLANKTKDWGQYLPSWLSRFVQSISMCHVIDFTVGVSFSVGGRVISYGYDGNVIFHMAWACRQLSAI